MISGQWQWQPKTADRLSLPDPATDHPEQISGQEGADERAATAAVVPRLVQILARETVLGGHCGLRGDAPGQRRVERVLVAARLVVGGVDASRGDLHVAGLQRGARLAVALADGEIDLRGADRDDLGSQAARLRLHERDEGLALLLRRLLVHDDDRAARRPLLEAQRLASRDDRDDAQAVEFRAVDCAGLDLPRHHRVLAGQAGVGVGETGTGEHIAGASLDILAANRRRRRHGCQERRQNQCGKHAITSGLSWSG